MIPGTLKSLSETVLLSQNTLNVDQRRGNTHIPLLFSIDHFFSTTKSLVLVSKVLIDKEETQHSFVIYYF